MEAEGLCSFIPLSRKVFDHDLWEEKRTFSKFEAWIDLIQTARFNPEIKSQWVNNREVKYGRGQLVASFRFLQKRWNWGSISKVETYLKTLKNKDMVILETGQGINIITICKYDAYNQTKTHSRTAKGRGIGQQKDESNNDNKENKKDITQVVPTSEADIDFGKFISAFNEIANRKFKLTQKVKDSLKARLREKYTKKEIFRAIKNAHKDEYHVKTKFKYLTPEFILRPDKLDRFLNAPEPQQQVLGHTPMLAGN